MQPYVLYAMPASLYSSKARSYLRTHSIPYVERSPGSARYNEHVVPTIGRWIIPVLELPDGSLIQDTVDIIDFLDATESPDRSAYPSGPVLAAIAHLLELFAGEGLMRPAMHFRWNFDDTNLAFLSRDFSAALAPPGADEATREATFAFASDRMRMATLAFGVTEAAVPDIEAAYLEFLDLLDTHLAGSPYILGGRPTIADHAFMGPLHAHLARDPYPSVIMKQRAQRVWRWVERMQAPNGDTSEYTDVEPVLFADDDLPTSLLDLLRYVATEYRSEILAQVAAVDAWLAEHPEVEEDSVVLGKPSRRFSGTTEFDWRGHRLTAAVVPYRMYLLHRLQAVAESGGEATRAVFDTTGLGDVLRVRPRRWVERKDNREVWGPAHDPVVAI